jgi:NAD(P)-dependent dehydrogenase (short-subunit alcohol dehydrogenase family)
LVPHRRGQRDEWPAVGARAAAADAEAELGLHHFHLKRVSAADPPEIIHYGVTKTAQLALSRGIAEIVAGTGLTVNSVLPGPTRSEGAG